MKGLLRLARALYLASQLKWALGLSRCSLSRLRRELAG